MSWPMSICNFQSFSNAPFEGTVAMMPLVRNLCWARLHWECNCKICFHNKLHSCAANRASFAGWWEYTVIKADLYYSQIFCETIRFTSLLARYSGFSFSTGLTIPLRFMGGVLARRCRFLGEVSQGVSAIRRECHCQTKLVWQVGCVNFFLS